MLVYFLGNLDSGSHLYVQMFLKWSNYHHTGSKYCLCSSQKECAHVRKCLWGVQVTDDLANISKDYVFVIPPYFALILRAFSVLEGIGLDADPDYTIVDECYPYISKRLLTDDRYHPVPNLALTNCSHFHLLLF